MKRSIYQSLRILLLTGILLYQCSSIPEKYPNGDFNFMVISDTHISNDTSKDKRLKDFITKINRGEFLGVELLFITGDVVSSHYVQYDSLNNRKETSRLQKAVDIFNVLNIPYYLIMGNHDYKIDSQHDSDYPYSLSYLQKMEDIWQRTTGRPPNFSFIYKGWKFIILSSFRGRQRKQHFSDNQLDWLKKELNNDLPSLLFFHHPLKSDHFKIWCSFNTRINPKRDSQFYDILYKHKNSIKGIFVGHGHFWVHDSLFEKIPVYETDSFADNEKAQFLIVAVDNFKKTIHAAKNAKSID